MERLIENKQTYPDLILKTEKLTAPSRPNGRSISKPSTAAWLIKVLDAKGQ